MFEQWLMFLFLQALGRFKKTSMVCTWAITMSMYPSPSHSQVIPILDISPPPLLPPQSQPTANTYFIPPPPLVSFKSPPPTSNSPLPPLASPVLPYDSPPPPPTITLLSPPPPAITPIIFSSPPPPLLTSPPPPPPPPTETISSPPSPTETISPPPPTETISSPPPPTETISPPPPSPLHTKTNSPPPPPPLHTKTNSPQPPPLAEPPLVSPHLAPVTSPKPPSPLLKPHMPIALSPPLHMSRPSSRNFTASGNVGPKHSPPTNNGAMSGATASIAALAGLMMLSFVGVGIWFVRHRKKMTSSGSDVPLSVMSDAIYQRTPSFPLTIRQSSGGYRFAYSPSDPGLSNSRSFFTYEDLSFITNGFSAQNLLAEGGFGPVYKGTLQDGREVAVKQLKVGGSQGDREFRAEVEIISRVHHRHLVSLVGYCILDNQRMLVYDYVPNKTLYYHLHGTGLPVMNWAARVKIAGGAARGVAYLHEDCQPRIIHRDIKSSNILLDNNFEAQVSDFGLAKLVMDASTHISTRVMGTFGYLAPEYASTGKLTAKSDVFSFGVVLLELITGRKPVDISQHLGDESLVEWARPLLNRALETGEIGELSDPRLEKRYNHREMFQIIEAAAACTRHTAALRPRMGQVVRALGNLLDSDLTNGVRPGMSVVINSGPNTEEIEIFRRSRFTSQDYNNGFR